VLLRIRLNLGQQVIEVDGRVVWESPSADGWDVGVEFERFGEGARAGLALLLADASSD
jgi:hypothetical protein